MSRAFDELRQPTASAGACALLAKKASAPFANALWTIKGRSPLSNPSCDPRAVSKKFRKIPAAGEL
jgi:hypothetical protein